MIIGRCVLVMPLYCQNLAENLGTAIIWLFLYLQKSWVEFSYNTNHLTKLTNFHQDTQIWPLWESQNAKWNKIFSRIRISSLFLQNIFCNECNQWKFWNWENSNSIIKFLIFFKTLNKVDWADFIQFYLTTVNE